MFGLPEKFCLKTMKLNPPQQQAIEYLGGALFVLAGAGSGKTRVITEKIAYMITQKGYKPHHIAAITFTNKAARTHCVTFGKRTNPRFNGLYIPFFGYENFARRCLAYWL